MYFSAIIYREITVYCEVFLGFLHRGKKIPKFNINVTKKEGIICVT